jgi:hypothetical protein
MRGSTDATAGAPPPSERTAPLPLGGADASHADERNHNTAAETTAPIANGAAAKTARGVNDDEAAADAPPWRKCRSDLVPGTEAYDDHMVDVMLHRENRLKLAAKLKHHEKAAAEKAAKLEKRKLAAGLHAPSVSRASPAKGGKTDGGTSGANGGVLPWSDELSYQFELQLARGIKTWPTTIKPSFSCEWTRSWFLGRPGPGFHSVEFAFDAYGGIDQARAACLRYVNELKAAACGEPHSRGAASHASAQARQGRASGQS